MAELVVSMVVGPLLSLVKEKASSYLLDQYKVMEGMEEQHKILMRKLPAILDVITDAEEQATRREGVKAWLKELKTVAYEANEAFDEFNYEALRREAKEKGHIRKLGFQGVKLFPTHNRTVFRNRMGNKLRKIVQAIEVLVAEMNAFGFNYQQQPPASKQWRQTTSIVIDPQNIARKSRNGEREKIVKMLIDNSASNTDLTVLPIFGMGGMGKTTLAQLIYNDPDIKKHFEPCLWVCVSDDFDVCNLINKIWDSSIGTNLEKALQRLKEELKGKRYLVVLDDVWNEDVNKWEQLKACLKQAGEVGSAVLTTTRKEGVAELMGTVKAHNIANLDNKFIKEIIESKAFGSKEGKLDELVKMVDDFVNKCSGSPLAANALGSVLRGKSSKEEWDAVLSKSIAHNKEDQILPILKLSYDDLQSHMKQCFSFCAVFPKDCEIDMDILIQLWMANGFVPKEKGIHLETTGKHIFEELVSRSFFQDVKQVKRDDNMYWYCPRTTCKIHDLMHDVALYAMENEVATITNEKPKQSEFLQNTCRHLFLLCDEQEALLNDSLKIRSPAIQTVLCYGRIKSSLHHLGKYNSVRALSLFQSKGTFLLKPKYLHHLRYLDVSYSDIESLPEDISILYHLHTLDVSWCRNLSRLPKQIKYMTALRHLYTHGCKMLKGMPPKLGQLTSLQTLTNFVVATVSDCSSIGELQHLDNLGGSLLLSQLENVREPTDAKLANLGNKKELRDLSLYWTGSEKEEPHCHKVLDVLEAPRELEALRINNYQGASFPAWMGMLPNMVELRLSDCKKSKNLPPLWQVPALQVLHLERLEKLQCLCSGGTFFSFPNLKELMLVGLPAFDRWCEVKWLQGEQVIFPHLEKLSIKECEKLISLPEAAPLGPSWGQNHTEIWSPFPALKVLELQYLANFHTWEAVQATKGRKIIFPHLQYLSITRCQNLRTLPDGPVLRKFCGRDYEEAQSAFPTLKVLKLEELENFQKLGAADEATQGQQIIFPHLENLVIEKCRNLIALPEGPLLQELCGGDYEQARSAFPALKVLELKKLEIFQKLGAADEATQGQQIIFPHLENLVIEKCRNLIALPEGPLLQELCGGDYEKARSSFPALKALVLMELEHFEGWEQVEATQGVTMFPNLEELSILDCPKTTTLPAGTSSLAPSVGCSDITTRSAFPKLKNLKFRGLKSFKSWGVTEATNGEQWMFPDLETVWIDGSPELTTLPEGPKLSSITIRGGHQQIFLAAIPRAIDSLSELELTDLVAHEISLEFSAKTILPQAEQGAFELADSKSPLTRLTLERVCDLLFHSNALALWTCFVRLQDLEIHCSQSLVYWPEEFQSLVSLRNLVIRSCTNLIGYPRAAPGQTASERSQLVPNLESLVIRGCGSLVEVFNVPASLKAMTVKRCPKVELEPIFGKQQDKPTLNEGLSTDVMARDHFLPCLESLTIWNCDSLSEVVNLPPSLREIEIWGCDKLQLLSGQLDALRTLEIQGCPELRSLKSTTGELQTLERLCIRRCKNLTPFLCNGPQAYSSLRELEIQDCPCIKSLPSSLRQRLDSISYVRLDARYEGAKLQLLNPKTWKYASCSN